MRQKELKKLPNEELLKLIKKCNIVEKLYVESYVFSSCNADEFIEKLNEFALKNNLSLKDITLKTDYAYGDEMILMSGFVPIDLNKEEHKERIFPILELRIRFEENNE